jgi:hypothetical protein
VAVRSILVASHIRFSTKKGKPRMPREARRSRPRFFVVLRREQSRVQSFGKAASIAGNPCAARKTGSRDVRLKSQIVDVAVFAIAAQDRGGEGISLEFSV